MGFPFTTYQPLSTSNSISWRPLMMVYHGTPPTIPRPAQSFLRRLHSSVLSGLHGSCPANVSFQMHQNQSQHQHEARGGQAHEFVWMNYIWNLLHLLRGLQRDGAQFRVLPASTGDLSRCDKRGDDGIGNMNSGFFCSAINEFGYNLAGELANPRIPWQTIQFKNSQTITWAQRCPEGQGIPRK